MPGIILMVILAGIGVFTLVAQVSRSNQPPAQKRATLLASAALLGLLAALFLLRGKWYLALPSAVGAVAFYGQYRRASAPRPRPPENAPVGQDMSPPEALAILGLTSGATADDIRAAHRKLIEQVHPDKGGNDYLAARINLARDCLLKDQA